MNVDTKRSKTQVVVMRLLGELAAKAGATDLPLYVAQSKRITSRPKVGPCLPYVLNPHPCRPSGQKIAWQVEQICQSESCIIDANADTNTDEAEQRD